MRPPTHTHDPECMRERKKKHGKKRWKKTRGTPCTAYDQCRNQWIAVCTYRNRPSCSDHGLNAHYIPHSLRSFHDHRDLGASERISFFHSFMILFSLQFLYSDHLNFTPLPMTESVVARNNQVMVAFLVYHNGRWHSCQLC